MNLEELLRTVLPSDEDRPFTIDLESSSSRIMKNPNLPKTLSKKTLDEVWRDIQQEKDRIAGTQRSGKERQTSLREMTLEDFLVKAGIVSEGPEKNSNGQGNGFGSSVDPVVGSQRHTRGVHWLQQYQQQTDEKRTVNYASNCSAPRSLNAGTSSAFDSAYPEGQNSMPSSMVCVFPESRALGRKRVDKTEKTVERRQKRMIKNRESAARSRERKQAYTNELENKVSRLEEENERLKKQKELDKILYNAQLPQPKSKLRRTSSAPI